MKTFNRVFTVIVFLFLYIPMIVLAVASFNAGTDIAVWKGFTFAQYGALFRDGVLLPLLANSVIVAVIASLVATVLGTMAAIGIRAMSGRMRRITMAVTNIPLTNPEIVTGVSLALLFAFAGQMMKLNNVLGFTTLLIAHITFNLPYVILSVMPKLGQLLTRTCSTPRSISAARPCRRSSRSSSMRSCRAFSPARSWRSR